MMNIIKQPSKKETPLGISKQLNYTEVVEQLNALSLVEKDLSLERMTRLDKALGSPSRELKTIFVSGTNGKSLTINFVSQLLREEGLTVGALYTPHVLTYNERIALNKNEVITNKNFTDLANEVLSACDSLKLRASASEVLTAIGLLYFKRNHVDVAVLEVNDACQDVVNICAPKIVAITRVISDKENDESKEFQNKVKEISDVARKDCWVISADQNKLNLETIQENITKKGAHWAMPIRKLAPLAYPFEQLHGRCAALAERAAQIFAENWIEKEATIVSDSLLIKPQGQRGRPTIEAKKNSQLNPKRTIEQFWKETSNLLSAQFQLLDKEKPSLLLDNASNVDALSNLLLGVRLLHYQRPLNGLVLLLNYENDLMLKPEFLKTVRYFFKKTQGQLIICPAAKFKTKLNIEKVIDELKNIKIKAKVAKDFTDGFNQATKLVDERNGLVVITGGYSAINEYWNYKGIKKF